MADDARTSEGSVIYVDDGETHFFFGNCDLVEQHAIDE